RSDPMANVAEASRAVTDVVYRMAARLSFLPIGRDLYRTNYHISVGMWCDALWKTHQKRFRGQPSGEKQRMFLFARSIDFYRAKLAKQRNAFACQSDAAIFAEILDCHNRNAMREPA